MKVELCDKRPVSLSPNNEDPFIQTVCNRHLELELAKNKFKNISELRNARVLKQNKKYQKLVCNRCARCNLYNFGCVENVDTVDTFNNFVDTDFLGNLKPCCSKITRLQSGTNLCHYI